MSPHEEHVYHILAELDRCPDVTQRHLSRQIGVALGLTNLIVRHLVQEGWVRAINVKPNRVRYLLTPAGILEKARMSSRVVARHLRSYAEIRNRVSARMSVLQLAGSHKPLRVVFLGASEIAEIAYICHRGSGLSLIGVVDDEKSGQLFMGMRVQTTSALSGSTFLGEHYDRLIVTDLTPSDEVEGKLRQMGVSSASTLWL